jgi:hypothetical protein
MPSCQSALWHVLQNAFLGSTSPAAMAAVRSRMTFMKSAPPPWQPSQSSPFALWGDSLHESCWSLWHILHFASPTLEWVVASVGAGAGAGAAAPAAGALAGSATGGGGGASFEQEISARMARTAAAILGFIGFPSVSGASAQKRESPAGAGLPLHVSATRGFD